MNQKLFRSFVIAACITAVSASTGVSQTGRPTVDFQTFPSQPISGYQNDVNTAAESNHTSARIRRNASEQANQSQRPQDNLRHAAQPIQVDSGLRRASYESQTRATREPMNNHLHDPLPFPESVERASADSMPSTGNMGAVKNAFQAMRSNDVSDRTLPASRKPRSATQTLDSKSTSESEDSDKSLAGLGFKNEGVSWEMIEKIGYNTLFVLAFGVGFIFVAKAWLKPGQATAKTETTEFEVLSSLKLPGKSNLMLVKVDSERLLVALDPTGVKSVTHLSDSFADKLESYSEISEPFAAPETDFHSQLREMKPPAEPAVYSRDTLVSQRQQAPAVPKQPTPSSEKAARNTEAIRKQMEEALLKFGLKV